MNSPGRLIAVIGSSNLSDQGLLSDGEIDLSISLPVRDQAAEQLAEEFNRVFRDALPLTKELIEDYSAGYELLRKHGKPKGLPKISGILKQSRKTDDARPDDATPAIRWWRDSIYGMPSRVPSRSLSVRRIGRSKAGNGIASGNIGSNLGI